MPTHRWPRRPAQHRLCCCFPFLVWKCQHFPFPWEPCPFHRHCVLHLKVLGPGGLWSVWKRVPTLPGRQLRREGSPGPLPGPRPGVLLRRPPPRLRARRGSLSKRRGGEKGSELTENCRRHDHKLSLKWPHGRGRVFPVRREAWRMREHHGETPS